VFFFGGMANGVANEPLAFFGGVFEPGFTDLKDEIGVVFGDVAEVVGDGAANVETGIVFESFEDG